MKNQNYLKKNISSLELTYVFREEFNEYRNRVISPIGIVGKASSTTTTYNYKALLEHKPKSKTGNNKKLNYLINKNKNKTNIMKKKRIFTLFDDNFNRNQLN